ncbi:TIGR04255 family protein [Methylocystis iwaonis]|uniref:TIGR04255 family protein n=1 Tax=Methylocystis iwaonis TaxID=2885079 RepID=UPI002E7AF67E|nr:TIGR04255 family protein [Methylocystis iwaonis]
MFEDVCYKKSFLTEVVARIDFVAPVTAFDKNISGKALKKIGSHFPIFEPRESIAQHIEVGPDGGVKQKELRGKQWNFFGREREKQLIIEPGAIYVRYTKYSRFEDLKDEFQEAVNAIDQEASGIVAQRFGLRYINQFDFEELKLSNVNTYFTESLLGTVPFSGYARNLTRNFHIVELKFDEIDVRFQFGFPNTDYPAVMKRPTFVVDIDAYALTIHPITNSIQYIEAAHGHIQKLFEESVTNEMRSRMNG